METDSTPKAKSACKNGLKWDQIHMEKQKDSTKTCQTMEELQKQNLNLLDEVDGIRSKLATLTAREVRFEKEQSTWRDRERSLESKLAACESNTATRQTARSVRETESRDTESQTEETSQTFHERQQELADLTGSVQTLNTRLQLCKQELVKFEVEQGKWREREMFLEAKISEYEKQMSAERGDGVGRESGEAGVEESSAETKDSIEPRHQQSGRVPEEIVALQNVVESLKQELRFRRSKEQDFEKDRARFSAREKEQEAKIQRLESRVSELSKKAREDQTMDKPCTREMEVQTDFTMQTIDDLEAEEEDAQDEFDHLSHSFQSAGLKFIQERAEWKEQRQELVDRATASESKLKAAEESLKEHLAMGRKVSVQEKERNSQEETMPLLKEESTQDFSFNTLRRKWEKASLSETPVRTETQSELCVDDSPAKPQLKSNKSEEHDLEKERFIAREKELEAKIKLLESQVTECREMDRKDCPQRETVAKPRTREMAVQTDFTMHTIDDMEHEVEDVQEEFKHLVQSLRSAELKFNKERAEWREQRQELEDRATASESNKSNQKECDEPKEEGLKEHLAKYHAMEQKVIVLEKERDSLEKTVALLKEESTQKDEAARRRQDNASTSESPAATGDVDPITQQQLDKMQIPRVRALVHRLRSHCGQKADALEEDCKRLRKNAQMLSGKLEEHERNEVRLEAERKEFERRAVEAETQLGKARDDMVRMEKAFREEREMFQEVEKQLHHLQRDNADLKTTVGNLKAAEEGLVEREKELEKASEEFSLGKEKFEESLKVYLERYDAMEQKVILLEKERDSLEETVALLKEESTQKDEASPSETPAATGDVDPINQQQLDEMKMPRVSALVHRLRSHCGQIADALEVECDRLRENTQTSSEKLQEHERNEVRFEAERKEFERRAVEAATQLGKARDDAVRMEKTFQEEREMFQKQLRDLQKDNADLKTTVRNLTRKRQQEENATVFQMSGASEALVSELRRQLQNEVTLRESLHRFHWEREKEFMAQQERLEDEKEQWVKRADELSEEKTQIFAMLEDERLKTERLEKKAEETALKRGRMKQAFRDELRLRDQEKMETKLHYEQELERFQQTENKNLDLISELTETVEQLETKRKEACEENKEHTAKEEQWTEAKEKLLSQIELLRAINDFNQRKKKRKGFFHRVFGRSN